jgi:catalase (peroxidase I)
MFFIPLNSWPENVNLDKARRLFWQINQKCCKYVESNTYFRTPESFAEYGKE